MQTEALVSDNDTEITWPFTPLSKTQRKPPRKGFQKNRSPLTLFRPSVGKDFASILTSYAPSVLLFWTVSSISLPMLLPVALADFAFGQDGNLNTLPKSI